MGNGSFEVLFGTPEGRFKKALEYIQEEFDYVCEENERLAKSLMEWNRDDEIQKLRNLAEWYRTHSLKILSDDELCVVNEFRKKHYHSCGNGSTYQYELTGTGVGTAVKIRCPKCGEEMDATDYTSW